MSKSNHYVDNEKFLNELLIYEEKRNKALPGEIVQPSDYISTSIIKISNRLLESPRFMKQMVDKDSLISEAVFDCVKALKNFDSKKSKNPFAYYTQIAYYAFLKVLIKEQKIFKDKCRMIQSNAFECLDIVSELDGSGATDDPNIENTVNQLKIYLEFNLEEDSKEKKKKTPRAPLYLQNRKKEEPVDEDVEEIEDSKPKHISELLQTRL